MYILCNRDEVLLPFLRQQVTDMVHMNGYTVGGILATLRYVNEKLDNAPVIHIEKGIRYIVTRYYYEAKQYYMTLRDLNEIPEEEITQALGVPDEVVVLKRSSIEENLERDKERTKTRLYGEEIDLNNIPDDYTIITDDSKPKGYDSLIEMEEC